MRKKKWMTRIKSKIQKTTEKQNDERQKTAEKLEKTLQLLGHSILDLKIFQQVYLFFIDKK